MRPTLDRPRPGLTILFFLYYRRIINVYLFDYDGKTVRCRKTEELSQTIILARVIAKISKTSMICKILWLFHLLPTFS